MCILGNLHKQIGGHSPNNSERKLGSGGKKVEGVRKKRREE
jgi:hypothetical protein